jgi:hypothetical protein
MCSSNRFESYKQKKCEFISNSKDNKQKLFMRSLFPTDVTQSSSLEQPQAIRFFGYYSVQIQQIKTNIETRDHPSIHLEEPHLKPKSQTGYSSPFLWIWKVTTTKNLRKHKQIAESSLSSKVRPVDYLHTANCKPTDFRLFNSNK